MARVDRDAARCSGRTSGLHFWSYYLVAALLVVGGAVTLPAGEGALGALAPLAIALGAIVLLRALAVLIFGTRWWVTAERVVQSAGVISRQTSELDIRHLREVEVRQGRLGRLLGIGSVRVSSAEPSEPVVLSGVRGPEHVADLIREQKRELAERDES